MRKAALLFALLLALLLVLACASSRPASTSDFEISIEQTDTPGPEWRSYVLQIELAVTVANRTEFPWRVDSVVVESKANPNFVIHRTAQPWGQTIAPGASNTLSFWTASQALVDFSNMEVPARIGLELVGPNGERRSESVTRNLKAWMSRPGRQR